MDGNNDLQSNNDIYVQSSNQSDGHRPAKIVAIQTPQGWIANESQLQFLV